MSSTPYKSFDSIDSLCSNLSSTPGSIFGDMSSPRMYSSYSTDTSQNIICETHIGKNITGPPGPRGYRGDTGSQGPRGGEGDEGKRGPQGRQGDDGLQGEPGIGYTGRDGPTGQRGPIGPTGFGREGPTGRRGREGQDGRPGENGRDGEPGPTGPMGPVCVCMSCKRNAIVVTNTYQVNCEDSYIIINSASPCKIILYPLENNNILNKRISTTPIKIKSLFTTGRHKIIVGSANNTINDNHTSFDLQNHQTVELVPANGNWFVF